MQHNNTITRSDHLVAECSKGTWRRQSYHAIKTVNFAGLNTSKFTVKQKQLREGCIECRILIDKKLIRFHCFIRSVQRKEFFLFLLCFFLQSTVEIDTFASTLPSRMMTSPTDKWPSTLESIFSSYLKGLTVDLHSCAEKRGRANCQSDHLPQSGRQPGMWQ